MMPHIRFAVCCILTLCSYSWAKGVALKPEVLPLVPDDIVPKIQPRIDVAGASQATFFHRSAMRSAFLQTEEDHMASSTSTLSMVTSPTALGGITNIDLASLGARTRTIMKAFEAQHTGLATVWWLTIFVFAVPVGCGLLFATITFVQQDDDDITLKGKVVDEQSDASRVPPSPESVPVAPTASTASPAPHTVQPALSPAEALLRGNSSTDAASASVPRSPPRGNSSTDAASASVPRSPPRGLSPQSFSRAVWTSGVIPPPLGANVLPLQTMASFWVSVKSLRQFYGHSAIDITGPFDYPMLRARLARGLGGSRLEVASEPFFNELLGCVGPLDYPANLSPNALIHGPKRELYGPFLRFGPGFAVGHFSRVDNVFLVAPKRTSDGIVIEITSNTFDGQQLAWARMVDSKTRYQISVHPGLDTTLMIICVLAAFVASQNVIDEVGTTIG